MYFVDGTGRATAPERGLYGAASTTVTANRTTPVTLVLPRAELIVDIGTTNPIVYAGERVVVNVELMNQGEWDLLPAPLSIPMILAADGVVVVEKSVEQLASGGGVSFSLNWTATSGNHTLTATVDAGRIYAERNTTNNVKRLTIRSFRLPTPSLEANITAPLTYDQVRFEANWTLPGWVFADSERFASRGFEFNPGDGDVTPSFREERSYNYSYGDDGEYLARARVLTVGGVWSNWSGPIVVNVSNRAPHAFISANISAPLTLRTVHFDANVSDRDGVVETYRWFVDGELVGSGDWLDQRFDTAGEHIVDLTVTDDDGDDGRSSLRYTVRNRPPRCSFEVVPATGNVTTVFQFRPTVEDVDGSVVGYHWSFGDGEDSTASEPTHSYADDGRYNVTLSVEDDRGDRSALFEGSVTVANLPPAPNMSATPTTANTTTAVTFSSNGTVDPDDPSTALCYHWVLGDGNTSTAPSVTHMYHRPGNYTVRFTVTDDDNASAQSTMRFTVTRAERGPGPMPDNGDDDDDDDDENGAGAWWASTLVVVVLILVGAIAALFVLSRTSPKLMGRILPFMKQRSVQFDRSQYRRIDTVVLQHKSKEEKLFKFELYQSVVDPNLTLGALWHTTTSEYWDLYDTHEGARESVVESLRVDIYKHLGKEWSLYAEGFGTILPRSNWER